jgi:predicted metal-dependent enzyme (double-stranded beta helix superfamily)
MAFTLDRFISDLKEARKDGDGQAAVHDVLARAVSEPWAMLRELGEPAKGGITPLYTDDDISIFNVVWTPLMVLVPHNHLMWVTIGIYTGREDNIVWRPDGERIKAAGAASICEKDVFGLNRDAIHSVVNPINKLTGAIHVYGGDLTTAPGRNQWDAETLCPQPFDFEDTREIFQEANARLGNGG